ncbi:hypothetical protein DPMN_094896 [Dreissena polymorpha]|uniref:Uncharacterized protein n=1 Tax=Dreissena polymorpha TaxID=45954 RepID=A0A9D4R2C7_DREPO|nr:hypothetical protein DPMN_094896 [Dreissena polymorpha]
MNRGKPGLHRESIKMFNTSGMNRESSGKTGNDRRGTGNNRDGTGNNRDGTVAPPGPIQPPALAFAGTLCRDAAGFHRGTTGDNRGSAGASPE